jgi:rhomboid protease GluP
MSETVAASPPAEASAIRPDTFCRYLVRQLMSKRGFELGTVPEAERLLAASDYVLTLKHGVPFTILCLVDRETYPGRTFNLSLEELQAIAADCKTYAPKVSPYGSRRMPVVIRVIEIGPTTADRWERLQAIKPGWFATKSRISALAVDPSDGSIHSSSRTDKPERAFIKALLQAPRETDIKPFVTVALPPKRVPYLTWTLMVVLGAIFLAELSVRSWPDTDPLEPSVRTLAALGGLQYLLVVGQGQWWRLFTGPLLHANLMHIVLNCVALFLAGNALERAVGGLWFVALFVIGGLGGACGSLLINPHNMISVGASGAIMGLFSAMFVLSFHYTHAQDRTSLQRRAMQVLIPSLLPLASAGHAGKVDYGAHAGGAIAGALAAYLLLQLWQQTDIRPRLRKVAMAIVAVGIVGSAAGASAITIAYPVWQTAVRRLPTAQLPPLRSEAAQESFKPNAPRQPFQPMPPQQSLQSEAPQTLIPSQYLPKKTSDIHEALAWWYVAKYPADPRSHFYKALFLLRKPDLPEAERELQIAQEQQSALGKDLQPSFRLDLQWTLALVLLEEDRRDEAMQVAAEACLDRASTRSADLQAKGLCANSN